jgi:hypothetical protein
MPNYLILVPIVDKNYSASPGDVRHYSPEDAASLLAAGYIEVAKNQQHSVHAVSVHTATADMKEVHTTSHPKVKKR